VHNLRVLQNISGGLALFPVLKADAYGHGAVLSALIFEQGFRRFEVPYFCVARMREAHELRAAGIRRPLLVLSQFAAEDFETGLPLETDVVVHSWEDLALLESVSPERLQHLRSIHINLNTGMNRLGFRLHQTKDIERLLAELATLTGRGIRVSGLMTHLARAEENPEFLSNDQVRRFEECVSEIRRLWNDEMHGQFPQWIHVSNSAGIVRNLGSLGIINAARPGLHAWGAFQTRKEQAAEKDLGLEAVLRVRAPIRQIFRASQGEGVGYGHRFICPRSTLVGTVSLGYADGIDRRLGRAAGGKWKTGFVVEGVRVPIIGTVSMDMTMVDLSEHPKCREWEARAPENLYAWWIGEGQTVEELAEDLDTITYEIFCSLGHRLPRRESDV
jgi:alanine racemase